MSSPTVPPKSERLAIISEVTAETEFTPPPAGRPAPAILAPLALWLAVQMAALLIAASRIPLSARYPSPEESLAVHVLLVVQIAASALLFPLLFRGVGGAIIVIATTIPFIQLAAFLATQTDNRRLALAALYVILWLIGLWFLNRACRTAKSRMHGIGLATLLSLGGATLAYLRREYAAPATTFDWSRHAFLGPITGCMAIVEGDPAAGTIWVFVGSFLFATLALLVATRWRQLIHRVPTFRDSSPR
jgi:hypothetical protein